MRVLYLKTWHELNGRERYRYSKFVFLLKRQFEHRTGTDSNNPQVILCEKQKKEFSEWAFQKNWCAMETLEAPCTPASVGCL